MSPSALAQAAKIIANLSGMSQQFAGAGIGFDRGSSEYFASMGTSLSGDTLSLLTRQSDIKRIVSAQMSRNLSYANSVRGGNVTAAADAARLVYWAMTVVDLLELTTGFGPPAEGDELRSGSVDFDTLAEKLKSALPDSNWQGSAAQSYANQDTALHNLAQTLASVDLQLASLVQDQAEWITHTRLAMGIVKNLLAAAYPLTYVLVFVPAAGPVAARIFALTVATLSITTVLGMTTTSAVRSTKNGQAARDLAHQYRAGATTAGEVTAGPLAQGPQSVAGLCASPGNEGVSANVSERPGTPSGSAELAGSSVASGGASATPRNTPTEMTIEGQQVPGQTPALSTGGAPPINGGAQTLGPTGQPTPIIKKNTTPVAPSTNVTQSAPAAASGEPSTMERTVDGAESGAQSTESAPIATSSARTAEPDHATHPTTRTG